MLRTVTTAALFAVIATAAEAGDRTPPSVTVAFGDLNLSHAADAKILAGRLQVAAAQVCRDADSGLAGTAAVKEMRACTNIAISAALARIAAAQTNAVRAHLVSDDQAVASN